MILMHKSYTLLALCLVFSPSAWGQHKPIETKQEEHRKDVGARIEERIEEFMRSIGQELGWERDTIPPAKKDLQIDSTKEGESREIHTFDGDIVIGSTERIAANVVVRGGNLTVYGTIEGDAMVVDGNLYVKRGGVIEGDVRVINGKIKRDNGGVIYGATEKSSTQRSDRKEAKKALNRSSFKFHANWNDVTTTFENVVFRYNRVEGIYLGLGSDKKYYWDGSKSYNAYGSVGYGFKSHRWRYNLGLTRQFALRSNESEFSKLFEFGIEGYSLTDSKDRWIVGSTENTLAAILIHEDFRDYFGREGVTFHSAYSIQRDYLNAQVKVSYAIDRYISLANRTEWSLFGGDKVFRPNPPINDGKIRSVQTFAGLSTVTKTPRGPKGWSLYTTAEFSEKRMGSDFDFSQFIADIRRYQPIGEYDNVNIRLRLGASSGTVPLQRIFEIGGLSTLQAHPFKSERGNRLILVNAEYIINGDFLHDLDFWPRGLMRNFNFLFLADAGWVSTASSADGWLDGFGAATFADFKMDVGVGLASRGGAFRLAFVWPTDRPAPARFIFRIARPF